MRFGNWLASQAELQRAFGVDFAGLRQDPKQLADYITWNIAALYEELGEMSHELPWPPWKTGRGMIDERQRSSAISEAVDALHFLGNILNGLGVTDDELSREYAKKQRINLERLNNGRSIPTPAGGGTPTRDVMIDDVDGARPLRATSRGLHYDGCPAGDDSARACVCGGA